MLKNLNCLNFIAVALFELLNTLILALETYLEIGGGDEDDERGSGRIAAYSL